MAAPDQTIVAFDLYGTLLSPSSIAKELALLTNPQKADEIAALWRRYQLQYTWRLNSMSALFLPSHPNLSLLADLENKPSPPFHPSVLKTNVQPSSRPSENAQTSTIHSPP